jgi:hypothetical protein
MMSVARGITPTYILTFNEQSLDLTAMRNVYVTFKKGAKVLTKTGNDSRGVKEVLIWHSNI